MAGDVLIHADTLRSPELRHEVPALVGDPFLYGEHDGRAFAVVSSLDADGVLAARPDLEVIAPEELGVDELLAAGTPRDEAQLELALRACRRVGLERAAVPPGFPVATADHLRAAGVELTPDRLLFAGRRRAKQGAELAGVRRAAAAAEAGMATAAALLREAEPGDTGGLVLAGEPLTCERVKAAVEAVLAERGMATEEFIVARGAQGALGHHHGAGPIGAGESVIVDLWPQDRASGCFADMTRTFVAGPPAEELVVWRGLCEDALHRVLAAVAPGVPGPELWAVACDVFEAAGQPTARTKAPGEVLRDGFFHGLGHGVGLEVHEAPGLGRVGDELMAGDVIAVEPGLYRHGVGGVRLEDLVLVTEDGAAPLTTYPYALAP